MTEVEWSERGKRWDDVLGESAVPTDHGFTF